jgi:ribose transport system substrate-binding protein
MNPIKPGDGPCHWARKTSNQTSTPRGISPVSRLQTLHPLVLAVCVFTLLPGCDSGDNKTSSVPGHERLHLAYVANSPGEFWTIVNLGCSIAAQQLGDVDVDFRCPAEATVEAQQQVVTNLLAAGVDGIAISPIDAEKQAGFLDLVATKTLLVCSDSDAAKSHRVSYIGTDNVKAGRQAADLIKEALPTGGKIALFIGHANAQNTKDRLQGLREGLAGANVEILNTLEDGQSSAKAEKNVRETLTKHPELAGVIGVSGYHGPALLSVVRQSGKTGTIKIVCFDDNTETLAGIATGDIHGTIAQNPFQIGKQTVVHMDKYLRGDKSQLAESRIFTSTRALTITNVDHYMAEQRNISYYLKDQSP